MPPSNEEEDVIGTNEAAQTAVETNEPAVNEAAPPADHKTLGEMPDNFQDLGDVAKELDPRFKENNDVARGPDGKFVSASGKAEGKGEETEVTGATGPAGSSKNALAATEGSTGPSGATAAETQTGATGATSRDADLDTSKLNPRMHESTRKVIEGYAAKAKEARDQAETRQREYDAIKKEVEDLKGQLKTIKAPKEMEDELATLRTRVRELDISKDPALQQKYDARIKKNGETAMEILKANGIFSIAQKDGAPKEMTDAEKKVFVGELEKSGFGLRGMAKYIRALEAAGEYESAERLRQAAAEIDTLGQQREQEIATWSKDYEGLQAQRTREAEERNNQYIGLVRKAGETAVQKDLSELSKQFPHLNPPAAVLPTDTAEVKAAKEKAAGEFKAANDALNEAVKQFSTDGLPPDKAAEATGRLQASAIKAVVLQQQVIPRLLKSEATLKARVAELEGELGKIKKAGTINRAHSAAITTPTNGTKVPDKSLSLEEAGRQMASEMGIKID